MPSPARADVFSFTLTTPLHYMQTRKFCKYPSKLHISSIHNGRSFIKLSSFSRSVSLSPEKRSWNEKKLCLFDSVPIFFWFKFDTISPCLYKEPSADSYLRFLSGMLNVFCFFFRDFRLRDGFRP